MTVDSFAKIVLDEALSGSNLWLAELSAFAAVLATVAQSLDLLLNTSRGSKCPFHGVFGVIC